MFTLSRVTPILRIFDEAKAREFYVGFLGFQVDWEHHGDGSPGASIRIAVAGLDACQAELMAREFKYSRPGIQDTPWGAREMTIRDPFFNRIVFGEPVAQAD